MKETWKLIEGNAFVCDGTIDDGMDSPCMSDTFKITVDGDIGDQIWRIKCTRCHKKYVVSDNGEIEFE